MSDMAYPDPAPLTVVLDPNMLACPECGQMCKDSTGLGVHRSVKHGYKGAKKLRKPKLTKPRKLPTLAAEYTDEPQWTADDIFTSVVDMLYPDGMVDVRALPWLIQWRADTERMLKGLP